MRALIGVDGSPEGFAAVQLTSRLLAPETDEVIFYYSPPPVYAREVPDSAGTMGGVQSFLASAVFERARQNLPAPLRQTSKTVTGTHEPRSGLLIAADEYRVDLIALGARGAGAQRATSIGTVARHIVHHSPIPVLIVRGKAMLEEKPLRLLLASDGSEVSKHAVNVLRQMSWTTGAIGRIITVVEPFAHGRVPGWLVEQLDDEQLAALGLGPFRRNPSDDEHTRQEVLRWCGTLPPIFACNDSLVVVGQPAEEILEAADVNQTDIIILGARKKGTVRRKLLGSTSEEVLRHASCSVLVVPEHERP